MEEEDLPRISTKERQELARKVDAIIAARNKGGFPLDATPEQKEEIVVCRVQRDEAARTGKIGMGFVLLGAVAAGLALCSTSPVSVTLFTLTSGGSLFCAAKLLCERWHLYPAKVKARLTKLESFCVPEEKQRPLKKWRWIKELFPA